MAIKSPMTVVLLAVTIFASACASSPSTSSDPAPSNSQEPSTEAESTPAVASASPTPTAITFEDVVVGGSITSASICENYTTLLGKYEDIAAKRAERLSAASGDSYKAAKLAEDAAWMYDDIEAQFDEAAAEAGTQALNEVSNGQAGKVSSLDAYIQASMESCGLADKYSSVQADVAAVDSEVTSVLALADDVPWYPKGYYEVEDGLAYKWVDDGPDPCGYSRCRYTTMKIISRDGCPSGLYVEVNKLDSSENVIDWTNDSVPALGPMQSAVLQFVSYNNNADSTQPVEFNCY